VIPAVRERISQSVSSRLKDVALRLDEIPEVRSRILEGMADDPPVNIVDGGTIRGGWHKELDELRDISHNSKAYIAQIEQRERTRTRHWIAKGPLQ